MDITLNTAAKRLLDADYILILSHRSPDGDTLGCASALLRGLHALGKKARFLCSDAVPKKFAFLFEGVEEQEFEPEFIVSVDIADRQLFGKNLESYAEKVDLCLDHHGTNGDFAKERYVEPKAAAACEVLFLLLKEMQGDHFPGNCGLPVYRYFHRHGLFPFWKCHAPYPPHGRGADGIGRSCCRD